MEDKNESNVPWWQPGAQLFLKLSGWIAGPAIFGVLLGKYLDKRYGTEPWLLISTAIIAFAVSMIMMVRIGLREMKKAEKENRK